MKKLLLMAILMVTAGCMQNVVQTKVPFDPQAGRYILQRGNSAIEGQAFMRQAGGNVVTCAGEEVGLYPATAYQQERMAIIYGSAQGGRRTTGIGDVPPDIDPRANSLSKTTVCDASGNFRFDGLAAGDYYVATMVQWAARQYVTEGGLVAQRVSVSSGQTKRVILN